MPLLRAAMRRSVSGSLPACIVIGLLWSLSALARPDQLSAQSARASAGPGTVSGVVTNQSGQPIENADVLLYQLQQRVRTNSNGVFRFDNVKSGKYTVEARGIGYKMSSKGITVKDSGAVVSFKLERTAFALPSVLTTADRLGLSGVIADSGYHALGGVHVDVIGANASAESDSAGAFFVPLNPGHYLVELRKSGFARQLVGVTVPPNEGRKLAAWMLPQSGSDAVLGTHIFDLRQRVNKANALWTSYYTREDMERMQLPDIRALGSHVNKKLMNPDCPVIVNGDLRHVVPLWSLSTDELEFVEVYIDRYAIKGNPRTNAADLAGKATTKQAGAATKLTDLAAESEREPSSPCGVALVAWLNK